MKKLFCLSLLSMMLAISPSALSADKDDMEKLQKDINDLQKELKKVQGARSNVQQELQKNETQMSELQKKVEKIQQEINAQNKQIENLNKERGDLEKARAKQQAQAAEQIRAAYQLGQQPQFKVFLNQESPERISRMMKYHSYFMAAHAEKVKKYLDTIAQLNELEPQIAQKTAELNIIKEEMGKQQASLQEAQAQRKQTLAKINTTISNKDKALQDMLEDRRQLQALLQKVARASTSLAAAPSYVPLPNAGEKFSSRRGRLPWPTQGRITHGFGSSQVEGQLQWNGVMIGANAGQQVQAVHYGRVVFADYFRGQGLLVIIDHGEGYLSLYAHNQNLFKKAGDAVKAGEAIASVGNTGGQNEAGLYFEIRYQGKAINPADWLARA
ncbi:peptidase M23 [Cellvibrio zantedeschiae]|uniref:Peptidase M23 n=1 Tax=Cellvibrio zantedeschiae TaxID=1237077 RepID=A0ABQ3BAW8_9GAMM|nr:peptidoglycan DD-metalloendopeptidase family protein [Cellvibrio zantedeschiae]GGY88298.1 peptidase M23 [Cellvibrio zantedeschiae]